MDKKTLSIPLQQIGKHDIKSVYIPILTKFGQWYDFIISKLQANFQLLL